ncbi:MAG TPA: hypothetical protein VFH96_10350, partial [Pyrinomonadaceae bacterium]|nr:hypothetical protein [Pyrinomonadaceae bacterium]
TVTWYLKEAIKTKKEKRQEAEREADRKKEPVGWPTREQLRAEEEEEAPAIIVTITDSSDNVVKRLTGPVGAGVQRLTWDLRYPAANLSAPPPPDADPDFEPPSGPIVMPGSYKAVVAKKVDGVVTQLGPPQQFQVTVEGQENMSSADHTALVEFQAKAMRLQRAASGATAAANQLRPRLAAIKRAIAETPSLPQKLQEDATALDRRTSEILRALSGDNTARQRNMNTPPSINDRIGYVVGAQRMSISRPTQTQIAQYNAAAQDFETTLAQLRQLIEVDLARLEKQLEAAGAPWTPGRIPDWKNQ